MNLNTFFDYPNIETSFAAEELAFLPEWSHQNWSSLLALTQTYLFSEGETAVEPGSDERAVYIVAAGQFEALATQNNARNPQRVSLFQTGAIIGEQTFLDGKSHVHEVRAVTNGELVRLSHDAFEIFAAREQELARDILWDLGRIVSLRLRQAISQP